MFFSSSKVIPNQMKSVFGYPNTTSAVSHIVLKCILVMLLQHNTQHCANFNYDTQDTSVICYYTRNTNVTLYNIVVL